MPLPLRLLAAIAWLLLAAPLIAVVAGAFGGISLHRFAELAAAREFRSAFRTSIELATLATAAGLLLGVPAALALARRRLLTLLLSPIALPGLVLGFGLLTAAGPADTTGWLFLGHLLLTIPWVARAVASSLESAGPTLEEEARGLGAGPWATLFLVTLPTARAGIAAAAVSAFLISFGNLALSFPLNRGDTLTVPARILATAGADPGPAVAASALLIGLAVFAAILVGRLGGVAR